jgi:hypothetical protein
VEGGREVAIVENHSLKQHEELSTNRSVEVPAGLLITFSDN